MRYWISWACVIACALSIACGDDETANGDAQTRADAAVTRDVGSNAGIAGEPRAAGVGAEAPAGAPRTGAAGAGEMRGTLLVEADIAAVLSTLNKGEIELGNLLLTRARSTLARDFARTMVNEHSAADERQAALFRSLGVAPSDNDLSAQLQRESRRVRVIVEAASAAAIDLTYARSQVDMHDTVLRLFDETLLPSAAQAEVRVELMLARAEVQRHLTLAMTLVEALQYTSGADAGVDDGGVDDAGR